MEKQIKRMFWEHDGKAIAPSFELEDGQIKRPCIIMNNFLWLTENEYNERINRLKSIKWWQFWK